MTGLGLILKQLGVNIKPEEIETEFQRLKELKVYIPRIVQAFEAQSRELTEMKIQTTRLEQMMANMLSELRATRKAA